MDIRGSRTLDAPRAAVFAAILDPNVLLGVIPGCREIEKTGDAEFRGVISLRLPGAVGSYRTVVRVVDADEPSSCGLEGEVVGTLGSIKGRASFRLTEVAGGTTVDYEGQAEIGGPLARLDARFVEGLAGSLVSQGLGNLESRLQGASSVDRAIERQPATTETSR